MIAKYFNVNTIKVGEYWEQAAVDYLHAVGYDILERKYRSNIGEFDIIAKIKDILVFIEVKTRKNTTHGYLQQIHNTNIHCRFDVIEIFLAENNEITYNHITNAFIK